MANTEISNKEFSIIEKYFNFIHPNDQPGLKLGIGDDAAVFSSNDVSSNLHCELLRTEFDTNDTQSASTSLQQLVSLIEADKTTGKKYLLLNLSLPEINEEWLEFFSTELIKILKAHNIILAGGDTTSGSGVVVYQLISK